MEPSPYLPTVGFENDAQSSIRADITPIGEFYLAEADTKDPLLSKWFQGIHTAILLAQIHTLMKTT